MELRIKGIGIEVAGLDQNDEAEETEYGFTEIESITVTDDDGNEVYSADSIDGFKKEASFDMNWSEFEKVRIDTETMEYLWEWVDEWNPDDLTCFTHVFSTPAGEFTVMSPEYGDESEEMIPDELMTSVVYDQNGEELDRYEN